jgi:hypothetical protein
VNLGVEVIGRNYIYSFSNRSKRVFLNTERSFYRITSSGGTETFLRYTGFSASIYLNRQHTCFRLIRSWGASDQSLNDRDDRAWKGAVSAEDAAAGWKIPAASFAQLGSVGKDRYCEGGASQLALSTDNASCLLSSRCSHCVPTSAWRVWAAGQRRHRCFANDDCWRSSSSLSTLARTEATSPPFLALAGGKGGHLSSLGEAGEVTLVGVCRQLQIWGLNLAWRQPSTKTSFWWE